MKIIRLGCWASPSSFQVAAPPDFSPGPIFRHAEFDPCCGAGLASWPPALWFQGRHHPQRAHHLFARALAGLPAPVLARPGLRWANLAFFGLFGCLTLKALPEGARKKGALLLLLYLANPWLAFRHDVYMPTLLALAAAWFWALATSRRNLAACFFGLALASLTAFGPWPPSGWPGARQAAAWQAPCASFFWPWPARRPWYCPLPSVTAKACWKASSSLEGYRGGHPHQPLLLEPRRTGPAGPDPRHCPGHLEGGPRRQLGQVFWLCSLALGGFLLFNFHVSNYFYFLWAALLLFGLAWPEAADPGAKPA